MRSILFQLIRFCFTRTVPAAETKSIGLQADARVVMVFAEPPRLFYHNMTNPAHLSGPRHLDNFVVTRNFHPSTGTCKNACQPWHRRQLIKPPGRYKKCGWLLSIFGFPRCK